MQERKEAIREFRLGLGQIEKLKSEVSLLNPDIQKMNLDFSLQNLDIIEHILLGLSYAALYDNLSSNDLKPDQFTEVAAIGGEAGRNFAISLQIVNGLLNDKLIPIPEQNLKLIKYFCFSNYVLYMSRSAQKMGNYYLDLHSVETTAGHYGRALGYINQISSLTTKAQQNKDVWDHLDPQTKELITNMKA